MKKYHKLIGFPDTLVVPNVLVNLHYTKHANDRREREGKHGYLQVIPSVVRVTADNIFEVETDDDIHCKKVIIRIEYNFRQDIVLVLELLSEKNAKVVTFWLNRKTDLHKFFNKEKYEIPKTQIYE